MVPRSANLENIKLINGGLSLSGVAGPVKASSVNGSIKADKLQGQAELSTVNGRLEAGFDKGEPGEHDPSDVGERADSDFASGGRGRDGGGQNLSGGIESEYGRSGAAGGHHLRAPVNRGGARSSCTT